MKKDSVTTLIILVLLTMPMHFLVAFAMVLRGKSDMTNESKG